jgi:hypothetical protein
MMLMISFHDFRLDVRQPFLPAYGYQTIDSGGEGGALQFLSPYFAGRWRQAVLWIQID